MREIRLHGSEGGGADINRSFLPLSGCHPGTLLTLVVRGLVETRLDHFAGHPLYRLSDVRKYMPPKRGRPSNESLIAMAKAKKPKGAKS